VCEGMGAKVCGGVREWVGGEGLILIVQKAYNTDIEILI